MDSPTEGIPTFAADNPALCHGWSCSIAHHVVNTATNVFGVGLLFLGFLFIISCTDIVSLIVFVKRFILDGIEGIAKIK